MKTDSQAAPRAGAETPPARVLLRAARELAALPASWLARRRERRMEREIHHGGPRRADDYFIDDGRVV